MKEACLSATDALRKSLQVQQRWPVGHANLIYAWYAIFEFNNHPIIILFVSNYKKFVIVYKVHS